MPRSTTLSGAAASLTLAVLASACSSGPSGLQTQTGDTRPQPTVVAVTTVTPDTGCWVQFYPDRNFKGEVSTLVGPVQIDSADKFTGKQIKKNIDSLVTGPNATLKVYEHAMFKDRTMSFGPNSREGGLITKLGIGGNIESLQLSCN